MKEVVQITPVRDARSGFFTFWTFILSLGCFWPSFQAFVTQDVRWFALSAAHIAALAVLGNRMVQHDALSFSERIIRDDDHAEEPTAQPARLMVPTEARPTGATIRVGRLRFTTEQLVALAVAIAANDGRLARDRLRNEDFPNLTSVYPEVSRELRHLKMLDDSNTVTPEGVRFFANYSPTFDAHLVSSADGSDDDDDDGPDELPYWLK